MKLNQWTVFLDILGFSNEMKEIATDEDAKTFVNFLKLNKMLLNSINDDLIKYNDKADHDGFYKYYDVKSAFISDSIIISYYPKKAISPLSENEIFSLNGEAFATLFKKICYIINLIMSTKRLLIRGGISNSYCYIEDEYIIGKGIVEAHEIEKSSEFPIIALHNSIIEDPKLLSCINKALQNETGASKSFIVKEEEKNLYYLDYLCFLYHTALFYKNKHLDSSNFSRIVQNSELSKLEKERGFEIIYNLADLTKIFFLEMVETHIKIIDSNNTHPSHNENIQKKYNWLRKYIANVLIYYNQTL